VLCFQFIEQRLGVFQIGGVEAFGEPAIDLSEHRPRFVAATLFREQPREAPRGAQLYDLALCRRAISIAVRKHSSALLVSPWDFYVGVAATGNRRDCSDSIERHPSVASAPRMHAITNKSNA
jgi:hypothetical protein